jgi:phosphoserine phosphatase
LPCYREGKVERLKQFLSARGESLADFAESWFYSDSHNDLPLLLAVRQPVAVRPDPILRGFAEKQAWPILDFREDPVV